VKSLPIWNAAGPAWSDDQPGSPVQSQKSWLMFIGPPLSLRRIAAPLVLPG
jgi:hypothetical protein